MTHPPRRPVHTVRERCRACGQRKLEMFLSLGEVALANAFLASPAEIAGERRFPLEVYLCRECGLVQLADVIDPEVLFKNYVYVTGTSDTIAAHNRAYAAEVVELARLGPRDLVVEVASNDGSLLACFQAHGVRVLGVEPAENIAARANARGIPTVARFFDLDLAAELREEHGAARVVIGNNVLAHVDEPVELLVAASGLMEPEGWVITEVPELSEFVARLEYDTVYHEHLSYFSVTTLMRVYAESGLRLESVERVPVHGGSVRAIGRPAELLREHAGAVRELSRAEQAAGLTSPARLERFAADVERQRARLLALLRGLRAEGKSLAGYGAPAKGNTLLEYCGIGPELVPYTVDKNPLKVGKLTPGAHIPVLPVETLLERQPDCVLILAWNFADEIVRQQAEYARRGGRFIVPIPEPRVL